MTYKEETYVLDTLKKIRDQTDENNIILKENNKLLKYMVKVLNNELLNARKENEDDFGRNVLANLLSNFINIKR